MSNISDLKAVLVLAAADITDDITRLECLASIDEWYNCKTALASISSGSLASYSMNGRTFTKRDIPQHRSYCDQLYAAIKNALYSQSSGVIDQRYGTTL